MRYANIEIGTKEVSVWVSELKDRRLNLSCTAKSRLNEVYAQRLFSLDLSAILAAALEGLRNSGGVDYISVTCAQSAVVVLDENDDVLFCLASRDPGIDAVDKSAVDDRKLFDAAGLVPDSRSSLYHLMALSKDEPHLFSRAACYMFVSDWLKAKLTGCKASDRSLAAVNGLVCYHSGEWNDELFESAGIRNLFPAFAKTGAVFGALSAEAARQTGFDAQVICADADPVTEAVCAMKPHLFITSWQGGKIGLVSHSPIINDEMYGSRAQNVKTCCGDNILLLPFDGYSLIERVKRQSPEGTTFDTIEDIARDNKVFEYIDIRDERLKSGDIIEAVNTLLEEQNKEKTEREVAIGLLYNSVARYTAGSVRLLDEINEAFCPEIYIFGQASKDYYLNSLITMHTDKSVISSPCFFSSAFAFINMMKAFKEIEQGDEADLIRNTAGLSTFSRKEEQPEQAQ